MNIAGLDGRTLWVWKAILYEKCREVIIGYPWDPRVTPLASKVLHLGNWSESATPCQKERLGESRGSHKPFACQVGYEESHFSNCSWQPLQIMFGKRSKFSAGVVGTQCTQTELDMTNTEKKAKSSCETP